jgi:uncharacterized Zn finger protein
MALALTLRKGHEVFVDHQRIVVSDLETALKFKVRRADGEEFKMDPNVWQEVFPSVWMQSGIPLDQKGKMVRLVIDAPQHIKILRGDLYRRAQAQQRERRREHGND